MNDKIHPLYFACGKHFEYVRASLESLALLHSNHLSTTYLYIDETDQLSTEQKKIICGIFPDLVLRTSRRVTGWGNNTIAAEAKAFCEVAHTINPQSFIARIDSDIVFISENIFEHVSSSDYLYIGSKESTWRPFVYGQGGCYFIRAILASKLDHFAMDFAKIALNRIVEVQKVMRVEPFTECPEDAAIYLWVTSMTSKTEFVDFYLERKEFDTQGIRSVAHFQSAAKKSMTLAVAALKSSTNENYRHKMLIVHKLLYRRRPMIVRIFVKLLKISRSWYRHVW